MYFLDLQQYSKNYLQLTAEQFAAKYKTQEMIGSGSYGQVFKVISSQDQEFAIKEFNNQAKRNVKQIVREVDNLKRLEHPNIVRFYECFVVDNKYFRILLQYCEGGNLEFFIKNNKVSQLDRLILIRNIAQGLAYAHQQKIVHRDLKPQNIFLGRGNKAKIGDFGCSILIENQEDYMDSRVGSPAYMDQRVLDNSPYDMSVDIYAFGLIIFFIYKSKGLYDECRNVQSIHNQKSRIQKNYDLIMNQLTENLPYTIKMLIKNCLQKDHACRYTAREISKLIEKQISQKTKQIDLATKSTEEEGEIEDQDSLFIIEILKQNQYLERKQKIQSTKRELLKLLNKYQEKMEGTKELQTMKYINPSCKQRLVAYLYFYYMFWLKSIEDHVTGTSSIFQHKYPQIDPQDIEPDFMEQVRHRIEAERKRYWSFLIKCCKEISLILRLLNQKLPTNFKEMIKMVCTGSIKFEAFQDSTIREQIYTLFVDQFKKEYQKNCGNDNSEGQRLKKIEDLCKGL